MITPTSAGEVVVSGGAPAFSLSTAPGPDDIYPPVSKRAIEAPPFAGGEDVRFHVGGGKLPGFDVSDKFPLVLLLQRPSMSPEGAPARASRLDDLLLEWSRGEPNVELWVDVESDGEGRPTMFLNCRFDSVLGKGTIPRSVLSPLVNPYTLLYTVRLREIQHGGFTTTVAIGTDVYTPDKGYPFKLVFE